MGCRGESGRWRWLVAWIAWGTIRIPSLVRYAIQCQPQWRKSASSRGGGVVGAVSSPRVACSLSSVIEVSPIEYDRDCDAGLLTSD